MIILIADDDEHIALALETMVAKKIPNAEIISVRDGLEAFKLYKNKKIDLILSDWNMPVMTGKELLIRIRVECRDQLTPFLMLTSRSDIDSVKDAISSGVTEYIAKPFDKKILLEKTCLLLNERKSEQDIDVIAEENSVKIQEKVMDIIRVRLKKDYIKFPVLPEVAYKAANVVNNENVSMRNVSDIVKIDTALSGQILLLANSVHYRAQKPLVTLEEAMARIGIREVMNVVLLYVMKELYRDNNKEYERYLRYIWDLSLITASSALELAKITGYKMPEKLYTIAMFYHVGKLMILPILMELKKERKGITDEIVVEVMNALSQEVGVKLLKHWEFSESFIDVVRVRCEFSDLASATNEAMLIIMASYLGGQVMNKTQDAPGLNIISLLKGELNLTEEGVDVVIDEAKKHVSEVEKYLDS